VDPQRSGEALERLCSEPDVQAVIVGQPQLTPAEKMACWKRFNRVLGRQGVAVDLVVAGSADAERLRGFRWHLFGDVAREGRVLYFAR